MTDLLLGFAVCVAFASAILALTSPAQTCARNQRPHSEDYTYTIYVVDTQSCLEVKLPVQITAFVPAQ